jgi:hypothetical protein
MGNQKVPGIVILHCNGSTYWNAYLIAFKVGPVRARVLAVPILFLHGTKLSPGNSHSEHGTAKSHSEHDPESAVAGWWRNKRCVARCRNHCSCLPLVAPPPPNCIAQPLINLHIEMASSTAQAIQTHSTPNRRCQRIQRTFWLVLLYLLLFWDRNTTKLKLNSMVWVRERTIPTEQPPLVGEVIANFCG